MKEAEVSRREAEAKDRRAEWEAEPAVETVKPEPVHEHGMHRDRAQETDGASQDHAVDGSLDEVPPQNDHTRGRNVARHPCWWASATEVCPGTRSRHAWAFSPARPAGEAAAAGETPMAATTALRLGRQC